MRKDWNLKTVHLEVFKFYRHYLSKFYTDESLKIPFKAETKEEFEALSDEEAFNMVFPELNEGSWKELLSKNDLSMG